MAVEEMSEGVDGLVVDGGAGAPRPVPWDVARLLSYLAHLLDERIAVRGVGGLMEFAAQHLGVGPADLVATTAELSGLEFQLAALALAGDFESHPPVAVIGESHDDAPRYEVLELGTERRRVPYRLAASFAPGTLAPCPLVVAVEEHHWGDGSVLTVHSTEADSDEARRFLDGLLERSRAHNPFRGRALEAVCSGRVGGVGFRVVELPPVVRADVVLPASVWDEVDRNVHGLFASLGRLAQAGLGQNRGVLLAGPPGTGKTLLCRVLAAEVPAGTTVVFCDAKAVANTVRSLYAELTHLAPALVVMEDIDLVVGDRHRRGPSKPLVDFLLALDGAISSHRGVVTVATTNDAASIDVAAKRAARFDRLVEVPPPEATGRAAILARYLRALEADVDVDRVAAATDGATGADLRELVTLAVLHATRPDGAAGDPPVATDLLLRLAAEAGYQPPTGLYL